jgi:hypothetical protein
MIATRVYNVKSAYLRKSVSEMFRGADGQVWTDTPKAKKGVLKHLLKHNNERTDQPLYGDVFFDYDHVSDHLPILVVPNMLSVGCQGVA